MKRALVWVLLASCVTATGQLPFQWSQGNLVQRISSAVSFDGRYLAVVGTAPRDGLGTLTELRVRQISNGEIVLRRPARPVGLGDALVVAMDQDARFVGILERDSLGRTGVSVYRRSDRGLAARIPVANPNRLALWRTPTGVLRLYVATSSFGYAFEVAGATVRRVGGRPVNGFGLALFSPDGATIAVGAAGAYRWGALTTRVTDRWILAFSRDGQYAATTEGISTPTVIRRVGQWAASVGQVNDNFVTFGWNSRELAYTTADRRMVVTNLQGGVIAQPSFASLSSREFERIYGLSGGYLLVGAVRTTPAETLVAHDYVSVTMPSRAVFRSPGPVGALRHAQAGRNDLVLFGGRGLVSVLSTSGMSGPLIAESTDNFRVMFGSWHSRQQASVVGVQQPTSFVGLLQFRGLNGAPVLGTLNVGNALLGNVAGDHAIAHEGVAPTHSLGLVLRGMSGSLLNLSTRRLVRTLAGSTFCATLSADGARFGSVVFTVPGPRVEFRNGVTWALESSLAMPTGVAVDGSRIFLNGAGTQAVVVARASNLTRMYSFQRATDGRWRAVTQLALPAGAKVETLGFSVRNGLLLASLKLPAGNELYWVTAPGLRVLRQVPMRLASGQPADDQDLVTAIGFTPDNSRVAIGTERGIFGMIANPYPAL